DLWSVNTSSAATANLFNGTTISGQPTQNLFSPTHTWPLNDNTASGTTVATVKDTTGTTPLTGQGGATWSTGDLFSPDVRFNSQSNGVLTSNAVLDLSQSFTVSLWAKPNATGGVLVSQDGNVNSGFFLQANGSTGQWEVCMDRFDNSGWNFDCAHAGANAGMAQIGVWTHLTVTYNKTTSTLTLYINGIAVGSANHTPVTGFTGNFRVGDFGSTTGGHFVFYNGALSNLQTWNSTALTPTQAALLSGTPGYVLFPADDTNYPSGSTWTTAHATMSFTSGQLKILQTGWANGHTWTQGTTGYPNAVLTLQRDGNLLIYPQAAHTAGTALWNSATFNNSDDCMFLQPDGNLVIYRADGIPLWSSGTYN
ncbi:LamG-like jellyroll fold domain-containing protein, partial [Kitasatospora phosalacinea]|uniref:LamG-like jellyroll fold domain-containing protein n=2 Tax=Kitasatospora phosalacinea TaxID=2065 RepID=UPI00331D7E95